MILAGIDIGTNSLRLLIVDMSSGLPVPLHADRKTVRLGEGVERAGALTPGGQERALAALDAFSNGIRRFGTEHTAVVATSVLRRASNADLFMAEVKKRTGLSIRVLSGDDEARLMLLGVTASLNGAAAARHGNAGPPSLVIDIGGGSTEIITMGPGGVCATSMPLGAVYLTERWIESDPPAAAEIDRLRAEVRKELCSAKDLVRPDRSLRCIGAAGTVTTLAAMAQGLDRYDSRNITGFVLERDVVDEIVQTLGRMTIERRKTLPGLEPGRADIVFAGAIVLQELMVAFGYASLLVSDWGLREGIVLDLAGRLAAGSAVREKGALREESCRK